MKNRANYTIVFLKRTTDQINNGIDWYEDKKNGLGHSFAKIILQTIESLQSDKIIYAPIFMGLSRVFVKRFPYTIYFKKDTLSKCIYIYGVLHNKQNRSQLDERL